MDKIMLVLPELELGGVEKHVLTLARGVARRGCSVIVVSSGGGLVSQLPDSVRHITMPVHKKNPASGLICAARLAALVRSEGITIIHAHSRVPAWIALFARLLSGVPFVYTAHARYSLNNGLWPLRRADGVICVSEAVRSHIKDWLPERAPVEVIYNSMPENVIPWRGGGASAKRLLYLGRLTPKKGPKLLLDALSKVGSLAWTLDIVGDGPMKEELILLSGEYGFDGRVFFHGHRDDPAEWIARCDLFVFPSFDEGMPLSLAEALASGAPVMASDIAAFRELTDGLGLLPPGDIDAWAEALESYLDGTASFALKSVVKLPTADEMAETTELFYKKALEFSKGT